MTVKGVGGWVIERWRLGCCRELEQNRRAKEHLCLRKEPLVFVGFGFDPWFLER